VAGFTNKQHKEPMQEKKSKPLSKTAIVIKLLLIAAVFVVGVGGMKWLVNNGPEAKKEPLKSKVPVVRVVQVQYRDHQLFVDTQGRVEPRSRTQIAAEVTGRVVSVSPQFKPGGQFSKGEVMLEIDRSDYVAALAKAESVLADARLQLEREEARAEQAARDWKKLGRGEPSDLVLGKPQIVSAKARVKASLAGVEKAQRDLDRTKLRAPYDCLVEQVFTDLGAMAARGVRLADVSSSDAYEVRVPVTLDDFAFLNRSENGTIGEHVKLRAKLAGEWLVWPGEIVRSEGRVDSSTMTMYQVVQVKKRNEGDVFSLPPSGLFVRAQIHGQVMPHVAEIPRVALRNDGSIMVMNRRDQLEIVPVDVARTLKKTILIRRGVHQGDRVIISPMEAPVPGMKLKVYKDKKDKNLKATKGAKG